MLRARHVVAAAFATERQGLSIARSLSTHSLARNTDKLFNMQTADYLLYSNTDRSEYVGRRHFHPECNP
jgi:hypothetical protein